MIGVALAECLENQHAKEKMRLAHPPVLSGASEELTPIATWLTGNAAVQTWRLRLPEQLYGRSLDGASNPH